MTKHLLERAAILGQIRSFFHTHGFLEVETPLLVPSPGLDLHLDAYAMEAQGEAPRYLITSPEYQMKRLLAAGYSRIFQICRCFRRAERGERHNPEFTMLEWYRAHAGMHDVMRDTEQLVAHVTGGTVRLGARCIDTRPPFERLSVADAFARFADTPADEMLRLANEDEEAFFRLLVDRVEPALTAIPHAVFLTDYPASQASLARKNPDDPRFAERFELYVAGVELCNGFGELVDATEQRARLEHDQAARKHRGLPIYPIDERFLAAIESGIPESGGNALGVDRLVALAKGTTEIGRVIAFTDDEL